MKQVAILKNVREGKVEGFSFDDFREDVFGGLNTTIDAVTWITELRTES